ncbi:hypothetical protein DUNSADRAFT_2636 [Dunaliella salina]|uniref:Encoded protein n=1 Tax=Dunaliella salina TaxID=3046 RepID=A0ABQ7FW21_DUNSA|nr:hypothetical protein DUNSADRAFT_2636 [Dunaliella salina]|eukprot:KAF5826579.1 hypothetical protein DUNSADRAFT_2636 [Dunaliella salina]
MGFQLTPASLRKLCKDLKLYSAAPELNDILHLQCKGITKLQHLDVSRKRSLSMAIAS